MILGQAKFRNAAMRDDDSEAIVLNVGSNLKVTLRIDRLQLQGCCKGVSLAWWLVVDALRIVSRNLNRIGQRSTMPGFISGGLLVVRG